MNIIKAIQEQDTTIIQIAKELDVAVSQIYYWDKHGISKNNKHYPKIKNMLPNISPKEATLKLNEEEDRRYNSGRKKKQLHLKDTNVPKPKEKEFKSTLFPHIKLKSVKKPD